MTAIATIRRRGHHRIVVKEAFGLAGGNAIRLWEPEILPAQRRWIGSHLEHGRTLVIEPWLERQLDFSVQLEMTPQGLQLRGYTGLVTGRQGRFQGNWAEAGYARRLPGQVIALFRGPPDISARLHRLYSDIIALLEKELIRADYLGPLGIDAFGYRTPEGQYRLKPIVEINPRYTMGRVTIELMKQVCPGSCGFFRIVNRAALRAEGFAEFPAFARRFLERRPLRREGEPVSRIREGAFCLNDPGQAQVALATFQVARSLKMLLPPP